MKNEDKVDLKHIGVKECLRQKEVTPFQLLMAELKSTTMDSYWNKEVGKSRYPVANLPMGMDPVRTTFGKSYPSHESVAEILKVENTDPRDVDPSKQINRGYGTPFNKLHRFGKPSGGNHQGTQIKKMMQWKNHNPVTKVSCREADFYSRVQPRVGQIKNFEETSSLMCCTFGKRSGVKNYGVLETLTECYPFNEQLIQIFKSLEYINKLRIIFKKRNIPFLDVEEELKKFDKESINTMDVNEMFEVLKKFRILPEREYFCRLLKILKLIENNRVNYIEAVKLLNWKCDFPELPKIEGFDLNHYSTTYNETIGNILPPEHTNQNLLKDLKHEIANAKDDHVAALISPNMFEQYGLCDEDILKPRSKETMLSLTQKLEDFPKESFDAIWEEGLKIDGNGSVCISTFVKLLEKYIDNIKDNSFEIPLE